jgi:hypothetical protein
VTADMFAAITPGLPQHQDEVMAADMGTDDQAKYC